MFKNYLKTAFRSLWRKKGSTIINVAGLSLGIASSLVLFLLIHHHSNFDDFHAKRDRIYRVVTQSKGNNGNERTSGVPAVLPEAFKNDFPEAEEVLFTSYRSGSLITIPQREGESKKYDERSGVVFAQPEFFKIFDRPILIGDALKGLDEPNEAVISKKSALKYFDKEDAVGEVVKYDNNEYRITAVMTDYGNNTDFPFDLMLSHATIKKQSDEQGWNSTWSDEHCYFLLKEGENISKIESRIPEFVKKHLGTEDQDRRTFLIQPLSDIHSNEDYGNYNYNTVPNAALISLSVIAIFLILTACINFINLATAEAIKRSKEVGIRKSLGSTRAQLISQFLGETTLVTIIAVVIAAGVAQLGLGFLNPFLEQTLSMNFFTDISLWLFLVGITLVVSTLSGLYPSFVVSGFNPALALKNLISSKNSSGYNLRRVLVIGQFFISQVFIIGTIVLINQMDYLSKKDLGFRKDAIISIPIPDKEQPVVGEGNSKMRTLKEELTRLAGVEMASLNSAPPSSGNVSGTNFNIEGKEDDFGTQVKQVDGNYIDLFGLEVTGGEQIGDLDTAQGFIVNQKLVETAGFSGTAEIIGKEIDMWGRRLPVVGVVRNFHTVSLSREIEPVVLMNRIRGYEMLSIKLNPSGMQETIKQIQAKWEAAYPNFIFSYEFLDEQIRGFYDGQRRMSVLLGIFTSMAIFIGCLGLFGLATFMANQRTKEIGVRKVLGASVQNIIFIFSREFVVLIFIGFVLAAPVAWYLMDKFLSMFAYKTTIGPAIFLSGIGVTVLIAMITVGYRSFRAATVNPVDSLKCE